MKTLKGDSERREEIERKLKSCHDVQFSKPFLEEEEEIEKDAQAEKDAQIEKNAQIEKDAELAKQL